MRITPRSEEIAAIVTILTSPGFDTPADMAKAILREAADIYGMRDTFALVHTWSDGTRGLNFGPFGAETEAKAFAGKLSIGGTGHLVKLYSPGVMLANAEGRKGWKGYCFHPECGHAPFTHSSRGAARGECQLTGCPCDAWQSGAPKKTKKASGLTA
ncbi:hypothetical protein [Streptomyces sp. NBC_01198]|uniref:hypothetical protein n=1 Tax=Streptomyces sp. NBC_01198 TaxID=2903769 RepID=UPI002E15B3B5|nr:hypothetical protein OG702_32270 [Streptomyces sp. NBC_01198]